ncbi:MAG: type IV secretion system protein VirB3 [Phenylobacterium sp.]|uniref:type IV secretion system protein VirB3 n=1 Tax=Phenylobacterium sp. TaxID=1871053 RepID=UPI00391C44D1
MQSLPPSPSERPLFLACTRPAMVAGVPMEAVGLNLIVSASIFLLAGSPAWLSLAVVLHVLFRSICRQDPYAFRVLRLFLLTRAGRVSRTFGGVSFAPGLTKRAFTPREALRGAA